MLHYRPFSDEEPSLPKRKPQGVKPMEKIHKILAKSGSLVAAIILWTSLKEHINDTKGSNISNMQLQAWERWKPTIIDTTPTTVSTKIVAAFTGKEEPKNTVIINPPGQEPAIQVITPDATITANKTGEVETITPKEHTQEKPLTTSEAKKTVDTALKDAAEKTLPKENPVTPPIPQKD